MTEEDLFELILTFTPGSLEGWLATVVTISAFLSFILPKPDEDAHPLLRAGHKVICVLGLGATRLRAAGKVGGILRKKTEQTK